MNYSRAALSIALAIISSTALAADYPAPKQADWVARDFKFHSGETTPELRLHYTTIGEPGGQPVLVLHGSGGSAASMLTPGFAGEMFGSGQPLDASNTTSSFRTASAMANHQSRPTGPKRLFRNTITKTWWTRSIAS